MQPDETNANQQTRQAGTLADIAELTFGQSVRERREQLGLSQRQLAEVVGVHHVKLDPTAITRIEKGQRSIRLGEAVVIAIALKMPLSSLLAERTTVGLKKQLAGLQASRERAREAMQLIERDIEALATQIRSLEADHAEGSDDSLMYVAPRPAAPERQFYGVEPEDISKPTAIVKARRRPKDED